MQDLSGKSIKGYELNARLGEGVYGAVYRASQPQVGREVAVKIILPEYANRPDFIRRFDTEAQLVAQLEHLHIVPLYDYWREPDGAYLVMRLMKGGSLEDSLRENGAWEPTDAARLVDQIASALEAAHKQGVVHRDLKPANILLDEDGNAYLSDFGIAKEMGAEAGVTQTGAIVGTPAYITPEKVQSQPVTAQTDIYALGVVLFELLVGGHPFPDTPTGELVVKHLSEPLPYVRESKSELPAAVDGVIQRATAKDPGSRYPDALSLAVDLRSALDMEAALPEVSEDEIYNPYKGLRAFQEADSDDFFGREALTGQLLARLAEPGEGGRFLAVVGSSGSGKSSVVKAGLVPALRVGALPGSDQWFITEMVAGAHPLEELERALMGIAADPNLKLMEELSQESYGLLRAAWMALPSMDSQLLLVIDQFKELFILVEDENERAHFLELLHTAVTDKDSLVRVIITLRADFYDRPLMYPDFGQLVEARTAIVLPLSPEELEQAIRAPAERVGAVLEKDLVPAIILDVADQPGALPLLQYALTELFERREGRMLTLEAYQSIGGVLGALGRRAEEVYNDLDQEGKQAARQLFLRLVTLGEGVEDTRRRVLRSELESIFTNNQSLISNIINTFGQARLLTFDRDPLTRGPTVEVAHEALLQEWRRLRDWLDESRADIRMQRVLGNGAAEWLESGKDASFLLRGSRLDQFEAWVEGTDLALTADEGAFLDASLEERRAREAAEAERLAREADTERRSRNFLRGLVGVLAVAAIVAVVLSVFAFNQQGIAQDNALQAGQNAATATVAQGQAQFEAATAVVAQEQEAAQRAIAQAEAKARTTAEAETAEERDRAVAAEQDALAQASIGLASQSMLELEGSAPERSVLLALEALENYPYTWQAERALGQAVLNSRLRLLLTHDDYVNTAEWSSDGTKILTAAGDGTVRVWDVISGEELLKITVAEGRRVFASWSPNEQHILVRNKDDNVVKVWETESGLETLTLDISGIEANVSVNLISWEPWSPSGDSILLHFMDGTVSIWDANTGETLQTLAGHQGGVGQAVWSPSGDRIASSCPQDGTVIVWQADTGKALYTLQGGFEDEVVYVGGWSPSGDRFTTTGWGGAKVYDSDSGRQLLNVSVPGIYILRVIWSPDGSRLLTSGVEDGTARVWDAETGREIYRWAGLSNARGSDWSPSGKLAAVGGNDGIVHVWEMAQGLEILKLYGITPDINIVEISPNGEHLLAVGSDNTPKVYDLSESHLNISVPLGWGPNGEWSPSGEQFAYSAGDGLVRIWDAVSGEELMALSGHEGIVWELDWSPTGEHLVSVGEDMIARIWDTITGELLLTFSGHEDVLVTAMWSPEGRRIATGDDSGKLIMWGPFTGDEILTFSGHQDNVDNLAWSPDGKHILSVGLNGEAFIWDTVTGEVLLDLFPDDFTQWVAEGTWTQDGKRVIIQIADGNVFIFNSETGEQLLGFPAPHSGWTISLSPSEKRILTGSADGRAIVWDATTGAELLSYEVAAGFAKASYSPDGTRVLVGTENGTLQVFPTWHSAQELIDYAYDCCVFRELTAEERELYGLPER